MVKWWHRSWRLQKEWLRFELYRAEDYNKVVCDVAVHTICVALDAPVSRSCKTYPVTQTKQNNWTGEARLRPGKCKMRSRVRSETSWGDMVKWWHRSSRLQKEWLRFELYRAEDYNKVVCDVAVRTICVALDAPVSRSCKTYPVTQTKQNNWTGEARLRPGKCKMRSRVWSETSWGDMVKWWHRSSRLQKEWLRFELYRAEDYNKVVCDIAVRTICVALDAPVSRSCKTYPVTQTKQNNWTGEARLRPGKCKMRSRVWAETSWGDMVKWWHLSRAQDYKKNDFDLSFTELKTTTRLCVTLRSALFALLWMPR